MIKILSTLLMVLMPAVALADDSTSCINTFYQTKDKHCIDQVAAIVAKADPKTPLPGSVTGFLIEIFSDSPNERDAILHKDAPVSAKVIYTQVLYLGGLQDEARTYADANNLSDNFKHYAEKQLPTLKHMQPESDPYVNDMLIGAYMASGNEEYIQRILQNFTGADDAMAEDAIRLGLMSTKFGPKMSAPGREQGAMVKAACQKYACKTDMKKMMRVMTLASAYWALDSLAHTDDGIKKTFAEFFENDPRLKKIIILERNGFANYLTALAAYAAVKDNAKINASLSVYESLGSPQDAFTSMTQGPKH